MDFEDVVRVWQEGETGEFRRTRVEDLSTARLRASKHLRTMARRGFYFAFVLLLIAVPLFGWAALVSPRPVLTAAGAVLLWGWLTHIVLFWGRLNGSEPNPSLPLAEAVAIELVRMKTLERFRESYVWSLIAFVAGEMLFFIGMTPDPSAELGKIVVFGSVVLFISLLSILANRRGLQRTVRPLREELESWTEDLKKFQSEGLGIQP